LPRKLFDFRFFYFLDFCHTVGPGSKSGTGTRSGMHAGSGSATIKSSFPVVPVPVPVPQQCVISIERCVREREAVPKFGRGFRSEGGEVGEGAVISYKKTTRDF
jgi:hypothetical protein